MNVAAFTKTYEGRLVLNMPEFELEDGCITAVLAIYQKACKGIHGF